MGSVIPAVEWNARSVAPRAGDIRCADRDALAAALNSGREQLLALFEGFERALGPAGLRIAFDPLLNLPLWELGHLGWFEEYWLARNPHRSEGAACDPGVPRSGSVLSGADALYDSSNVPHTRRWSLDLPSVDSTRAYLSQVREATLGLLRQAGDGDGDLYFFRLVLMHEAMHREAWHFMAQRLGVDLGPAMTGRAPKASLPLGEWHVPAGTHRLGHADGGFAFDNELPQHALSLGSFSIDRSPVSWRRFMPFVASGGYENERFWAAPGWAWRTRHALRHPLHLRRAAQGWQQQRFGAWVPLDLDAPALHLTAHEAEAWCRWAGRRLPTEAEWESAAVQAVAHDEPFDWGEVWEWTASPFVPYDGFAPHPYRDYSQPWFDGRPVLRGGSFATTPHMKHPRYRNFFNADRHDVFAGFRSCACKQNCLQP